MSSSRLGVPRAARDSLLRTLRDGLRRDHLRCAGSSESGAGGVSEALPIAHGSLAMSVIRFMAGIVTAIAGLAAHRPGTSAWE